MGLFDVFKNQFIEVIEWTDSSNDTLVYRFPVEGNEIKMGAQLTVRESQVAIFVNEGTIADVFEPGKHTLATNNMPVMTKLKSWKFGFNSPFKAEVYFVSTRLFTDLKWGTPNPVMMRDPEFGIVRLRAFGIYSMRVNNPEKLFKDVVGTDGWFTTDEITGQLKRMMVSGFSSLVGSAKIPVLDLAGNYDSISSKLKERMQQDFNDHGFELVKLFVENISLPPDVEKVIDQRTSMGITGVGNYAQFQMAQSLGKGGSGAGMANMATEMAAGLAMGQQMASAINQPQQAPSGFQQAPSPAPQAAPAKSDVDMEKANRFFILARTALKNTKGDLTGAMASMLESNRQRSGLSEEVANELIDKARTELGLNTASMDEYKEILSIFLADDHLDDDEKAILVERQIELGLSDEQVGQIEADLRAGK